MKNWDIWIAGLLLLAGMTCLLVSIEIPFIHIENAWARVIHIIEIIFLVFISVFLIGLYKKRREPKKHSKLCSMCKYALANDWNYCPRCGTQT